MATEPMDPQAQLAEVVAALGPRLGEGETPGHAVARLVDAGIKLVERTNEYFTSARRNAEENERLTAELADARRAVEAVCTTLPEDTDVRVVMSAIIGICEHEDGPTVIQYIRHLEKLLKAARAEQAGKESVS